ncbi:hypothetical protein BDV29DRAFT_171160 [Aspergillus leporis]|jgi:hypothetical protein|uniref:Uncharacterized protein n=1 Tax=Aspergillus leporis TaxID=41062 RepID=A0A5N5X6Y8_9EURO|nr:hypothetical protein BDV29DRAFT_171160 [Aspergillus leporis]
MSLNTASGLTSRPPKLATGNVKSTVQQGTNATTKTAQTVTDDVLPGGFPGDENAAKKTKEERNNNGPIFAPVQQWFRNWIPSMLNRFESTLTWLLSWILPEPRQARLYEEAAKRPASSTFIICQLICCGVPLLVFLAGVFLFAAVAVLLWCVLSLLILGPVLLVASFMGVSLWGWGWLFYGLIRWIDQTYLGGLISSFWFSKFKREDKESEEKGETKEGDSEET